MADETKLSDMQQKVLNGVRFESLPESTIATSRTFKKQFFQKSTYSSSSSQAICDWNTGAEFVNPRRSYLALKVKVDAGAANFGWGGVTNLIRRVVLTSRSGTELSRTEDYNRLAAKLIRYGCSLDHVDRFGELMGFASSPDRLVSSYAQVGTVGITYLIPLVHLSGFFEGDGASLIPPQLAAGLRVELTMESDARALQSVTSPIYEVEDIYFMLNTTSMVDSWQRQLNEESARDGLTYSFSEWHTTQSTLPLNQTKINIEVRKAVARALMAFVVTQTEADAYTRDNMKSDDYTATSVEWRLGSMYPYQQPIKNSQEMYFQAQNAFDSDVLDCKRPNSVSLLTFQNGTADQVAAGAQDGDAIIAVSLERNDVRINGVLNIGGLPTNNSRVLAVDITTPGVAAARQNFLYMKHLRVVKAFLDNVAVSE